MQKTPLSWLFKMSYRDSRRNRSRLLLFISSIILGIAAMVAIYSLGDNMRREIDNQAATLLGADLELRSNKKVSDSFRTWTNTIADRRSEERSFTSMIYFTGSGGTRLVQVRALSGEFPYYGKLETEPSLAGQSFRNKQAALVDQTLMLQYNARIGDSIKLGTLNFVIEGSLTGAPGQTGIAASVAPIVYIPLQYLEQTGLEQKGSRIGYNFYFKFDKQVDINALVETMEPRLNKEGINYDTVESQREDVSRSLTDLIQFLSLVSFIALLLGCIGVASAIHIYVREKINAVAILRCLGAQGWQAFMIYLIQIVTIGLLGSMVGAAIGTIVQQFLPYVLKDFLPLEVSTDISWPAIAQGLLLGIVISFLFALLPLVSIRNVSPLNTLRISLQPPGLLDPVKWLVYFFILVFILLFSYFQLKEWDQAFFFTGGVLLAFFVLVLIARLLMLAVRKFFPDSWSYLWRQGLANLFRPNNQTIILVVAIGLGTTFICILFTLQSILLNRVNLSASSGQSNAVLFDIQPSQKDSLVMLTQQQGLPIHGVVPIVNMRLEQVNQVTAAILEKDSTLPLRKWVFSREYRVTFRDTLTESEKITKGRWVGKVQESTGNIFISLEERFAERNDIGIGDTMVFNVQGSIIPTIVGSYRKVDFNRIQTNFLVVFPSGVLEEAPQFMVLLTKIPDKETSARYQQLIVKQFPNVSMIDLTLVLNILDDLLDKVGFVIRFMAAFSIFTGLIVLIASVLISKYQRMQESVLLRTLGASRRQIYYITALEYFFLGTLAAATGIILSLVLSWLLAEYIFETAFTVPWLELVIVFVMVCMLTVFIGLVNSRGVVRRSPLEILREQG